MGMVYVQFKGICLPQENGAASLVHPDLLLCCGEPHCTGKGDLQS